MPRDLSSLERAITKLQEGLARHHDNVSDEQLRDGLIQRFEFTYELGHKMLKRYLETTNAAPVAIDALSFQELIRLGNEKSLLRGNWTNWRTYREMRSKTGHTYDEKVAELVVREIPDFLAEAEYLFSSLQARIKP